MAQDWSRQSPSGPVSAISEETEVCRCSRFAPLKLRRFGTRLHAESVGRFGTCPAPKPAKRPTFSTTISAPQLHLVVRAVWGSRPRHAHANRPGPHRRGAY